MLRAYDSLLTGDQQARSEFLDILKEKQQSDEYHEYVREVMARCSELPLSEQNKSSYRGSDTVYAPIEVSVPPKIITKPQPIYPEQAKANHVEGRVVLVAVLGASGKVTDVKVVEGLPYGMTESCIAAAVRIRFEPAKKDNHLVSTLLRIEYYFGLSGGP